MTAVVLAALSGLSYGASDFSGAMASKKNDATSVTFSVQVVSLGLLSVIVPLTGTVYAIADLGWGALGGLAGGVGLLLFYRALAIGPMSAVASVAALVSAAVPVTAGIALGDRPATITLVGVFLAVPAAVLVSAGSGESGSVGDGDRVAGGARQHLRLRTAVMAVAGGFGFGLFFIALSRTSSDAGLFPLVSARFASAASLLAYVALRRGGIEIGRGSGRAIGVAGALDCAANAFYLTALRSGTFTWVAAISSLYPVSTVLLARVALKERLGRVQIVGLLVAGAAMVLVAIGA